MITHIESDRPVHENKITAIARIMTAILRLLRHCFVLFSFVHVFERKKIEIITLVEFHFQKPKLA